MEFNQDIKLTFQFTILLGFNGKYQAYRENEKKNLNKTTQITEFTNEVGERYETTCGDFIGCVKIEYELIPKKLKFSVEVLCWSNIVKISTNDSYRFYNTYKLGENVWIPVTVHHLLNELTGQELMILHSQIITFNVTAMKKEVASKLQSFYRYKEEDEGSEIFFEYFEDDSDGNIMIAEPDKTKQLNKSSKKSLSTESIFSWVEYKGRTHRFMVRDTIMSLENSKKVLFKNFSRPKDTNTPNLSFVTKQQQKKREEKKREEKKREEKKGDPHFILPAETLFTDPKLTIYKLREPNDSIIDGFIFLTVRNLMTRKQKLLFNPFVVKIIKLENLPVDILNEQGYRSIYITYDIPDLASYESQPREIAKTIYFDDNHVYFSKKASRIVFLEHIRSGRVRVEIKGIREEIRNHVPNLFGKKKEDAFFSSRLDSLVKLPKKNDDSKIQTLAVANFDISPLLKDVWTLRLNAPCHHPSTLLDGIRQKTTEALSNIYTVPEINLQLIDKNKSDSPLLERTLISEGTSLDMEFYFLAPQFAIYHLQKNTNVFKRIFVVIYKRSLAQMFLASVLQHNENIIGLDAFLIDPVNFGNDKSRINLVNPQPSSLKQASLDDLQPESRRNSEEVEDVITGFMVDNGTETYIYVEGIVHGYILEVWNKLHKLKPGMAKIFLNSEADFCERLYEEFVTIGLFEIILKRQFEEIFKQPDVYLEGTLPIPCSKALQKFNLLLQTEGIGRMFRFELFPTEIELVSFDLEFGVPLKSHN